MKNIKINIDKRNFDFTHPESFNELSEKQYIEVVRLFFIEKENLSKRVDDQLRLLFVFLGGLDFPRKKRKQILRVIKLIINDDSSDFGSQLLELNKFIYTDKTLNSWKIPFILLNKKKHLGPTDRFDSMTFGNFIAADTLASAYFSSKKPEKLLDMLVQVLYNCDDVTDLSPVTKFGILYNYLGVRNWLTDKYKQVFTSDETSSKMNISLGKKESGWMNIRRHIAGSVLNLEKTDNLNLHEVLSSLNSETQ